MPPHSATLSMRSMHGSLHRFSLRTLPAVLVALLAAACAGGPPPDTASGLARLEASGNPLGCFPNGPVCRAFVSYVDGRPVGYFQGSVEVPGGERRLFIVCHADVAPRWAMQADVATFKRNVYARLAPGRAYRVRGEWDGARCTPTVIDVATGQTIPLEDVVVY